MAKFKVNADALARLIEAISERPRSVKAIADETGLSIVTVRAYVNALHRRRQVHIAGWEADTRGRFNTKKWMLGPGLDAPSPRLTAYQRQVARRDRIYAAAGKPPPRNAHKAKRIINSVFALGETKK